MADQDYSNASRADLLREIEMMRKALRATQDSINARSGSDYAQRALDSTAYLQRNLLAPYGYGQPSNPWQDRMISDTGKAMAKGDREISIPGQSIGRNATQNLKVWEAFQKAKEQQALQDTSQELLEDVDLKDLEELFKKAFKGEDIKNLGQGVLQYGAQGFMSDFGPGGMLKNLIDLLKQVGTRREIHFPERYKQRNYDITLPDESGFQWPEFKPELEKSGKVGEQQALQARPRPLRPGPKGIRSPQR